jgi:hypothetical protein
MGGQAIMRLTHVIGSLVRFAQCAYKSNIQMQMQTRLTVNGDLKDFIENED